MKSLMKMGIWYSNLAKRLFRKKTFLGILVLVPLLVAALSFTTDSEAGVLKIAIVQEAKKDQAAEQLCERLLNQDSVILYIETESREEAMLFLQEKKVDAVYILKEDFSNHLEQYFKATLFRPSLIEILQREENVSLRLAREKLFGELYDSFSRELYVQFIQENFEKPQISPVLTCKELLFYYEKSKRQDSLFVLSFPGGEEVQLQSNSYLLSPIRGLLSQIGRAHV